MYRCDSIKHSPPQEYHRNAALSVGHDTGEKHSKKLSSQATITLPYPSALTDAGDYAGAWKANIR